MKTEIITINNKLYTRIIRPADHDWIKEQLETMDTPIKAGFFTEEGLYRIGNLLNCETSSHYYRGQVREPYCWSGTSSNWHFFMVHKDLVTHTITTLPALPRYPTDKDADLIIRYFLEGIQVYGNYNWKPDLRGDEVKEQDNSLLSVAFESRTLKSYIRGLEMLDSIIDSSGESFEITHCTDKEGNKVEVAIV